MSKHPKAFITAYFVGGQKNGDQVEMIHPFPDLYQHCYDASTSVKPPPGSPYTKPHKFELYNLHRIPCEHGKDPACISVYAIDGMSRLDILMQILRNTHQPHHE